MPQESGQTFLFIVAMVGMAALGVGSWANDLSMATLGLILATIAVLFGFCIPYLKKEVVDTVEIEDVAAAMHDAWMGWARTMMATETLSKARLERWETYMVPYSNLDEQAKVLDREQAMTLIKNIRKHNEERERNGKR